jgi:hypothetical protein
MTGSLTPAERLNRQRSDHLMLAALDASSAPIFVTGHRTPEDVRANSGPVPVGDRTPPAHYRVVYDYDTLRAPGARHRPTVVHVAPLASGGYPTTQPSAWVISEVVPWTPHFAANVPICHGTHAWAPNRTQLVDYVVHIGKLLNFDEPPPVEGYHGYNPHAVEYWRTAMRLQPLNPGLRLPAIRAEDVIRSRGRVRLAQTGAPDRIRFKPAGSVRGGGQPSAGDESRRRAATAATSPQGPDLVAARPRFARAATASEELDAVAAWRFAPAGARP